MSDFQPLLGRTYTISPNPARAPLDPRFLPQYVGILGASGEGTIRYGGKCFTTGPEGYMACNESDPTQRFTLTTDGRIYNRASGKFYTTEMIPDDSGLKSRYRFTETAPKDPASLSLWNQTTATFTPSPTLGVTPQFALSQGWFNDGIRVMDTDCSPTSNCPDGWKEYDYRTCHSGFAHVRSCILPSPRNNETAFKEACASGDPSAMVDKNGKLVLDADKCKILYTGAGYDPKTNFGVWAPWSYDTRDTQSVINFCAQHDTTTDGPFLQSSLYPNCLEWYRTNVPQGLEARTRYCTQYPSNRNCVEFCKDNPACNDSLKRFCVLKNLETEVCQNFCKQKNVQCDTPITEYCATLKPEEALKKDMCGCFRGSQFYNDYFNKVAEKFKLPNVTPQLPDCFYGLCAGNSLKTFQYKQSPITCPNVRNCIQITEFNNQGQISGDVTINAENVMQCGDVIDNKTGCPVTAYKDSPTGTCVECPPSIIRSPSKDGTTCLCKDPLRVYDKVKKTCELCPPDKVINSDKTQCVDKAPITCTGDMYYDRNTMSCRPCGPGTTPSLPDRLVCIPIAGTCTGRQFFDPVTKACKDCPQGTIPTEDRSGCIPASCTGIQYLDPITKTCKDCPTGQDPSPDRSRCIPRGQCAGKQYLDRTTGTCKDCPSGRVPLPDRSDCVACTGGQVPSADGARCVTPGTGTPWYKLWWVWLLIIVAVLVLLFLSSSLVRLLRKTPSTGAPLNAGGFWSEV